MRTNRWSRTLGVVLAVTSLLVPLGCYNSPVDVSDTTRGPAPLRIPSPGPPDKDCCYEDALEGHRIFTMYCAACHNARSLAERPFSNYQNASQHMRVRANLTGKEYAKLMAWLRRWHDVPAPELREVPSAKRFIFSQPIPELRQDKARTAAGPVAGPRPGATDEASPGQPPPGTGPQEGR
jgi:hypothetical protein